MVLSRVPRDRQWSSKWSSCDVAYVYVMSSCSAWSCPRLHSTCMSYLCCQSGCGPCDHPHPQNRGDFKDQHIGLIADDGFE